MAAELLINLQNNTSSTQTASLFNINDVITNPNTSQYIWDVTSFSFVTEQTVRVQRKTISETTYTDYTASISTLTIQGVVNALNTLGIGIFKTYSDGGSTYIATYSADYVFGQLRLFDVNSITGDYDFNVSLRSGDVKFLSNSPQFTITVPSGTNGSLNNPTTLFTISNDIGITGGNLYYTISVYANDYDALPYTTYTDFFDTIPTIRNYTFNGGDVILISFRDNP